MVTIVGDTFIGSQVDGQPQREVIGHVVLTQGDVTITCDKATQLLVKNDAILEGNVVCRQKNITIKAPRGYYFGNDRIAACKTGVTLDDKKVILKAVNGTYYFNESKAFFTKNVKLYDTVSTLTCNEMTYFRTENKAIAVGKVTIVDSANTITSDSLTHFRSDKISIADHNVKIVNFKNNAVVYGSHLENYTLKKYSLVTGDPLLMQIDTTGGKADTLLLVSRILEAYTDTSNKFVATDSVKILRGDFASVNEFTVYEKNSGKITSVKKKEVRPVLWAQGSQLTGDTTEVYMKENSLTKIKSKSNSLLVSQNKLYPMRYDQISGDSLTVFFDTTGINSTEVKGNVLSIYYVYDGDSTNGLTKSSSATAKILFKDKKISKVKLFVSPVSEYYPENMVGKNELAYTLPSFKIYNNRPFKNDLLKKRIIK
jgi:lipopolysaccharide export system protein LptA